MFEFKKLCDEYEKLTSVERGLLLAEKSVKILAQLTVLDLPEADPVETLAGFIIGSVVADGKVNEQEYLLMYPALIQTFGYDFDFYSVKQAFSGVRARKLINEYTDRMLRVLDCVDETLRDDIIMLCLCVTAVDGKISLREKRYVRRICKA